MKIEQIKRGVIGCTRCELYKTRTHAVPGSGNPCADIVFVGEAPGRSEDLHGEPFVGAAGNILSTALEKAGMTRSDVYITNVVKCRPPDNRVPLQEERAACQAHLREEIKAINPKIICVMGNTAFHSLLGGSSIMKFRGNVFSSRGRLYFVSLHPAAAIYNQKLVNVLEDDMQSLSGILKGIKNGDDIHIDYKAAL